MSRERLLAEPLAHIPQLGGGVARARDERAKVGRERQRHHVAGVAEEGRRLLAGLDVPERAAHITRAGDDLIIVDEAAAGEVAGVAGQLARHAHIALARLQTVDGADVVQAAARDKIAGGRVRARHHPRRAQRDGVHLVRGVAVPHDQLAVLRRRHQVARVAAPVHRVDLGQVAAQRAPRAHLHASDGVERRRRLHQRCVARCFSCILKRIIIK